MVNDYWKNRIEAEQLAKMERGATLGEEMDRLYSYHFNELEKEIRAFEQRYADKNGLSLSEVKARVDDFDVKSFEEKAKRYVAEKNFSARANSELALYNLKMKTNRLALLQYQLDLELVALAEDERQLTERFLNDEFIKVIETQSGLLGQSVLSASQIGTTAQAILNTPFHGANWSDNIWKRQTALREVVAKMTERLLLQGKNPTTMVAQLRKEFNVLVSEAKRLAVTEGARVSTEGQKQAYIANEIDEYEFIAEPSACPNCAKKDGKIFKVEDMIPGENAPPMHPWCHCSTGAHVGDSIPKLGQARKSGDKVFITDQSIQKVPLINIPGYSAVESSNIQLAHKQLLAEARDKNNSDEIMYIWLGEKPIKVFGDQFGVEINSHADARFILNSSKQRTLTVLHNHPGGSTFSLNDFNFFMGTPSVKTLTVVSNTGRVMYVTKTDSFDFVGAVKILKEIDKIIDSDIERVFKKMYNHGIRYKLK
ncbi:TPA: minor capsid protein [Streptococcus suis]